jgi:hypothetical protein
LCPDSVTDSIHFVDEKLPDYAAETGSFICLFLLIVGVQQFFYQPPQLSWIASTVDEATLTEGTACTIDLHASSLTISFIDDSIWFGLQLLPTFLQPTTMSLCLDGSV